MSAHFWGGELEETKRYKLGKLLSEHHPPLPADDGHAPQRQGRGLSALPAPARPGPLRGTLPRGRAPGRHLGHHAAHGQGGPASALTASRSFPSAGPTPSAIRSRRREASSTTPSPSTCARSSTGPTSCWTTSGEGTVGFALTILQRRLASSPEAIYQSLKRRRERLEKRLAEM